MSAAPQPPQAPLTHADVLSFWQETMPEMRDRPYVRTHAGRLAATVNELRMLFSRPPRVLDIAGNTVSRHIFSHFLGAGEYLCTPKDLDIELGEWQPRVPEDHFDLALCTEVIEHMSADPARVLWEANRSLRRGGLLLITTPNICSCLGTYNLLHGRAPYHWAVLMGARGDRHQREYAPLELQELTAANGFAAQLFTRDVYEHSDAHALARGWIEEHLPCYRRELGGDTIFVLAQKLLLPAAPVRLDPIYESSLAAPRDAALNETLQANCSLPIDLTLLP